MTTNIAGHWDLIVETPMGPQEHVLTIVQNGETFTGEAASEFLSFPVNEGHLDGDHLYWSHRVAMPLPLPIAVTTTVKADAVIEGDTLSGTMTAGLFGSAKITARRKS